jgi:26S proteasome regulatory subunit N11
MMDYLSMMNNVSQDPDSPIPDTGEVVLISSLSLLKMLKHGKAGAPLEVMGLMLGEFVDVCIYVTIYITLGLYY